MPPQTFSLLLGQSSLTSKGLTVHPGVIDSDYKGKGVRQSCILPPCLFNFCAEYIMRNAGLGEAQAGIKIAGKISITSDMQMTSLLCQKHKEPQ